MLVAHHYSAAAFYLPYSRFWELMIGSGLAYAELFWTSHFSIRCGLVRNATTGLGLALLGAAAFRFSPGPLFPGWWALVPTAGTALVIMAGASTWINRLILSNRVLVFIGLISYPLYLWHWPIISFARIIQGQKLETIKFLPAALMVLAFILACLTYEFVEKPLRFGQLNFAPRAIATGLVAAAMLVMTPLGLYTMADGFPNRFPEALRWTNEKANATFTAYRAGRCFVSPSSPVFSPDCVRRGSDEPLIFLWGDSHAADLYPGLRYIKQRTAFGIAQFTTSSCPPLLGVLLEAIPQCRSINDEILARVLTLRPDFVILSAQWYTVPAFNVKLSTLAATIAALKEDGISHILVVGPVPIWKYGLPVALQQFYLKFHTIPSRMTFAAILPSGIDATLKEVAQNAGAAYVSPLKFLCNDAGCLVRVGDRADDIVAWDSTHLTIAGSIYLVDQIFGDPVVSKMLAASRHSIKR
jgi:hypothetical protein